VADVDRAMRRQQLLGGSLDTNLLELQLIDLETLESSLNLASNSTSPQITWLQQPSTDALAAASPHLIRQAQFVPIALEQQTIHILSADTGLPQQVLPLAYWFDRDVEIHYVPQIRLFQAMNKLYGLSLPVRLFALDWRFPADHIFNTPPQWQARLSPIPAIEPLPLAISNLYNTPIALETQTKHQVCNDTQPQHRALQDISPTDPNAKTPPASELPSPKSRQQKIIPPADGHNRSNTLPQTPPKAPDTTRDKKHLETIAISETPDQSKASATHSKTDIYITSRNVVISGTSDTDTRDNDLNATPKTQSNKPKQTPSNPLSISSPSASSKAAATSAASDLASSKVAATSAASGLTASKAAVSSAASGLASSKAAATSAASGLTSSKAAVSSAASGLASSKAAATSAASGLTSSKAAATSAASGLASSRSLSAVSDTQQSNKPPIFEVSNLASPKLTDSEDDTHDLGKASETTTSKNPAYVPILPEEHTLFPHTSRQGRKMQSELLRQDMSEKVTTDLEPPSALEDISIELLLSDQAHTTKRESPEWSNFLSDVTSEMSLDIDIDDLDLHTLDRPYLRTSEKIEVIEGAITEQTVANKQTLFFGSQNHTHDLPSGSSEKQVESSTQKLQKNPTTSPFTETQTICEISDLFSSEQQNAHTYPGLPAFPAPIDPALFREPTTPDYRLKHRDNSAIDDSEASTSKFSLHSLSSAAHNSHKYTNPVQFNIERFLTADDREPLENIKQILVAQGGSIIPFMLQKIPSTTTTCNKNKTLQDRLVKFVEICEEIGEPALLRLLQIIEKEEDVQRIQALNLLNQWLPSRAIAPLLQRLYSETNPIIQRLICNTLRKYRPRNEFSKLLQFLRENLKALHTYRLQKSLFYLGNLRAIEAISDLIPLLEHEDADVRKNTLETLSILSLQNFDNSIAAWNKWLEEQSKNDRKQWVVDAMNHSERDVRLRVKEELQLEFGDDFGYEPDSSSEERETVRKLAALWLQQESTNATT
jgi:hypothetical protein